MSIRRLSLFVASLSLAFVLAVCVVILIEGSSLAGYATGANVVANSVEDGANDLMQQDRYLINPNFECGNGVYQVSDSSGQELVIPTGWIWTPISGTPKLISTQYQVNGGCGGPDFVDRLEGEDSFMFRSADIESEPDPGKPFDVAIYQQVTVTIGTDYSVSGFMVSFCGGSASPSDCSPGYTINKMVGLDPTGGTDPLAESVIWVENREPHTAVRYANLYVSATATSSTVTVFIRVHSPFQWHGNHAIIDLFSMVETATISITNLPASLQITGTMGIPSNTHIVEGRTHEIRWEGAISDDIQAIDGEDYELTVDVQYQRRGETTWTSMVEDHAGDGCQVFAAPSMNETYLFRSRGLAARPTTGGHRYPTVWSEPVSIHFMPQSPTAPTTIIDTDALTLSNQVYIPTITNPISLVCN